MSSQNQQNKAAKKSNEPSISQTAEKQLVGERPDHDMMDENDNDELLDNFLTLQHDTSALKPS